MRGKQLSGLRCYIIGRLSIHTSLDAQLGLGSQSVKALGELELKISILILSD